MRRGLLIIFVGLVAGVSIVFALPAAELWARQLRVAYHKGADLTEVERSDLNRKALEAAVLKEPLSAWPVLADGRVVIDVMGIKIAVPAGIDGGIYISGNLSGQKLESFIPHRNSLLISDVVAHPQQARFVFSQASKLLDSFVIFSFPVRTVSAQSRISFNSQISVFPHAVFRISKNVEKLPECSGAGDQKGKSYFFPIEAPTNTGSQRYCLQGQARVLANHDKIFACSWIGKFTCTEGFYSSSGKVEALYTFYPNIDRQLGEWGIKEGAPRIDTADLPGAEVAAYKFLSSVLISEALQK